MIPKRVHLFWTSPPGDDGGIPADALINVNEWRRLHPDYDVTVWSLEEVEALATAIASLPLKESIRACRFEAMKSDIARLVLVHQFGGYYSDLKNRPLVPFLREITHIDKLIVTEHPPSIDDFQGRACNAFLGAMAGNPFILQFLEEVCNNIAARVIAGVAGVTGNACLRKLIMRSTKSGLDEVYMIPSATAWGTKSTNGWMKRVSISYNRGMTTHWSVRQKTESLYV